MLVGTVSDFDGKYELQIPRARLSDGPLFLVCTYVDIKLELPIPQPTESCCWSKILLLTPVAYRYIGYKANT